MMIHMKNYKKLKNCIIYNTHLKNIILIRNIDLQFLSMLNKKPR